MLTLSHATDVAKKIIDQARELEQKVSVAIVDTNGTLVLLHRMDGALNVSPDFATAKALTASQFGMATSQIGEYAQPGKPYYGLTHAFGGKFMTIAGGVPLKDGDQLIGGVGVGGSYDVAMDEKIASVS